MNFPKVISVAKSETHTMSKQQYDCIFLLRGLGVEGDAHCGATVKHRSRVAQNPLQPNLRQVHLIQSELFEELKKQGFTIVPALMGENITTQGIDLLALPRNTILSIGNNAKILITGLRNPCNQLNGLQQGLLNAVLDKDDAGNLIRKGGVMAIVLNEGEVKVGDLITISYPAEPHEKLTPV